MSTAKAFICKSSAGLPLAPSEKAEDGGGCLLAMGRPPQNSLSSIWSSSGSICQLRDTAGCSVSGLAISTVLSIGAVWNLTGRRVSGSQEDAGSSGGAQRCTNGKPHIVVLSVTQLPLSCDWGGNTLSNLSAACYCRSLSITPQAAKLSIGMASSEAPENFSGAYRSGGFRQHHNGHHAVLPAKIIYVLVITFSARKNKSPSHQVKFCGPFASG